jgi:hypothetical protein
MKRSLVMACAALAALLAPDAEGAIVYSTPGSTYSQNFDSLPITPSNASLGNSPAGWIDDSTSPPAGNFSIPGWYLFHPLTQTEGGANGNQRLRIGGGSTNTGAFWSYGAASATERALGSLAANTLANAPPATQSTTMYIGARLTNNTGAVLDSFTLSYVGEQWRDGGAATPNAQSLAFEWKVNAANLQDVGFTAAAALDFTSPTFVNTGGGAAADGNATANRLAIGPVTVSGLNWQPGEDLWIRWGDLNNTGNDHALAIDDLSFSADAVPEPTGFGLAMLASAGLLIRRRSDC